MQQPREEEDVEEQDALIDQMNPDVHPATSMSVMVHQWMALSQQRETARLTAQRFGILRSQGRQGVQTGSLVKRYDELDEEISVLETQMVELLKSVRAKWGDTEMLSLIAQQMPNLMTGTTVVLPLDDQVRLAAMAGYQVAQEE